MWLRFLAFFLAREPIFDSVQFCSVQTSSVRRESLWAYIYSDQLILCDNSGVRGTFELQTFDVFILVSFYIVEKPFHRRSIGYSELEVGQFTATERVSLR